MNFNKLPTAYQVFAGICILILFTTSLPGSDFAAGYTRLFSQLLFLFVLLPIFICWTIILYFKSRRKNSSIHRSKQDTNNLSASHKAQTKAANKFVYFPKFTYNSLSIAINGSGRYGQIPKLKVNKEGLFFYNKDSDLKNPPNYRNVDIASLQYEFWYSWKTVLIEFSSIDYIELVKEVLLSKQPFRKNQYTLMLHYTSKNGKKVSAGIYTWQHQSDEWDKKRRPNTEEKKDALLWLASEISKYGNVEVIIND